MVLWLLENDITVEIFEKTNPDTVLDGIGSNGSGSTDGGIDAASAARRDAQGQR